MEHRVARIKSLDTSYKKEIEHPKVSFAMRVLITLLFYSSHYFPPAENTNRAPFGVNCPHSMMILVRKGEKGITHRNENALTLSHVAGSKLFNSSPTALSHKPSFLGQHVMALALSNLLFTYSAVAYDL